MSINDNEQLCLYCERLFEARISTQKFCSRRCKEEYRKSGRMSQSVRQQVYEEKIHKWTKPDDVYIKDYAESRRKWRNKAKLRSKFRGIKSHSKEEILELRNKTTYCELCGDTTDAWCADHDHKTGVFRGIICHP